MVEVYAMKIAYSEWLSKSLIQDKPEDYFFCRI